MDDFVSRLLAAIEETEREAPWVHHKSCASFPVEDDPVTYDCDCGVPASVLRRCAADRRTVERHMPRVAVQGPYEGELICGCSDGADEWHATRFPCEDVRDRADAYGLSDHQKGEE